MPIHWATRPTLRLKQLLIVRTGQIFPMANVARQWAIIKWVAFESYLRLLIDFGVVGAFQPYVDVLITLDLVKLQSIEFLAWLLHMLLLAYDVGLELGFNHWVLIFNNSGLQLRFLLGNVPSIDWHIRFFEPRNFPVQSAHFFHQFLQFWVSIASVDIRGVITRLSPQCMRDHPNQHFLDLFKIIGFLHLCKYVPHIEDLDRALLLWD